MEKETVGIGTFVLNIVFMFVIYVIIGIALALGFSIVESRKTGRTKKTNALLGKLLSKIGKNNTNDDESSKDKTHK